MTLTVQQARALPWRSNSASNSRRFLLPFMATITMCPGGKWPSARAARPVQPLIFGAHSFDPRPSPVFQFRVVLNFPDRLWAFEQPKKPLAFDLFPGGLLQKTASPPFTYQTINRGHQIHRAIRRTFSYWASHFRIDA